VHQGRKAQAVNAQPVGESRPRTLYGKGTTITQTGRRSRGPAHDIGCGACFRLATGLLIRLVQVVPVQAAGRRGSVRRLKAPRDAPPRKHLVLRTDNLAEAQELTSRIWSKHRSRVTAGAYHSEISRRPLGRLWLCQVDCRSPMRIEAEGNLTKATFYLPQSGSIALRAGGETLPAVPGGPVLIPARTAVRLDATPVRCIVLEIPAAKLRAELDAFGLASCVVPPLSWGPRTRDARLLAELLTFACDEEDRDDGGVLSSVCRHRVDALIMSVLARAIATRLGWPDPTADRCGRVPLAAVQAYIRRRLRSDLTNRELADFAGVSVRALQKEFLKHFNTTPTHYLRDLRMEAARTELRARGNTKTVAEIAMALDFLHLGRFAAAYRRKFGESPSATLKRRRGGRR